MTSNKNTQKTDSVEGVEAEASVPQQSSSVTDKVTVLKDRDGKDAIIIGEEDNSLKAKFNRLIRNKKVLAGVGTVAALVVVAIIKSAVSANNTELEFTVAENDEEDYNRGMVMAKALDEGKTLVEAQAAAEAYTHTD